MLWQTIQSSYEFALMTEFIMSVWSKKTDNWDTFSIWYTDVMICRFRYYLSFSLSQMYLREYAKLRPYVLTCQRALRTYVLRCQRALRGYVLTWQRFLRAYGPTCHHALRAYMFTCLACLRAHVPCMLSCSRANLLYLLTRYNFK